MSSPGNHLYDFGAFRIDCAERVLFRDGDPLTLTPKAFDLLLVLVERRGRVLGKEELMTAVWAETAVEESNLTHHISVLRKVLGERPGEGPYIETIPRRGYRFLADVKRVENVAGAAGEDQIGTLPSEGVRSSLATQPRNGTLSKGRLLTFSAIVVFLLAGTAAWSSYRHARTATGKNTILLADFDNKTGDDVFDGTLKQALAIQLQQSALLNLFPEAQARQTMRLMGHSSTDRMTVEAAREICQRSGLTALIAGIIAPLGSHYVITLEAINGQNGESLARQQVEVDSKEQVVRSLAQAAARLRESLGESLSTIKPFDKPLFGEVTTSNLEALKAWQGGVQRSYTGKVFEAIPFYKRAVEIDPNFAQAWAVLAIIHGNTGRPTLGAQYAERAYALRDLASDVEKLRITATYHAFATGNLDKRLEALNLVAQMYPTPESGLPDAALTYNMIGDYERAVSVARTAMPFNAQFSPIHWALGLGLLGLNRLSESKDVFRKAFDQNMDNQGFHTVLYKIAFIENDREAMQREIDWTRGKPVEYMSVDWQTGTAAFGGQWRKTQELSQHSIAITAHGETQEVAASYAAEQALRGALFEDCGHARTDAARALGLARGRASLPRAALALAYCGEASRAKVLSDELIRSYPEDTLINSIWLPAIRGAIELRRGNTAQALVELQASSRCEGAAEFLPQYLRGQAYLRLKQSGEAAAEFQKIIDHRGQAPLSPLYPLAYRGLASAAQMAGDEVKSRKSLAEFKTFWKDADSGIAQQ